MEGQRPFAAVIGGLHGLEESKRGDAQRIATELGVELAAAGFNLVVYNSDPLSLEPHVVAGYACSDAATGGTVVVRYCSAQRGKVAFKEERDSATEKLFDHRVFPGTDWRTPFYESLLKEDAVDAVVLLAGDKTTLVAGQIAIARALPLLAVHEFGGAAERVWEEQKRIAEPHDPFFFGKTSLKDLVRMLRERHLARDKERTTEKRVATRRFQAETQRRRALWAAASALVLIAVLALGTVGAPSQATYPILIFGGLVAAGATGALVRALLSDAQGVDTVVSATLGGIAGLVVGLAYLVPQLFGSSGGLFSTGTEAEGVQLISRSDKIQFISAILVAIPAGVGFDAVFGRLRAQADSLPIGSVTLPEKRVESR